MKISSTLSYSIKQDLRLGAYDQYLGQVLKQFLPLNESIITLAVPIRV